MAQAIYIPSVLRARFARVEAKQSTKHSRSASVRLFAVSDVIRAFSALVARFKGEASADVTVAEPLSDKNLDALKSALKAISGKDVTLNVKVDPSIIGGLVVKLGSRMVDSSLRTKLNSIKHAMKEAG